MGVAVRSDEWRLCGARLKPIEGMAVNGVENPHRTEARSTGSCVAAESWVKSVLAVRDFQDYEGRRRQ
jgi:hypothetical protein